MWVHLIDLPAGSLAAQSDFEVEPMRLELQEMGNVDTSLSYFQRYHMPRDSRILDIGTYFGSFVHKLRSLGYGKVTGIDVDFEAVATGLKAYPHLSGCVVRYGGQVLPFADKSFDAITLFDVLEHVAQPGVYLRDVQRILKPNGLLIFQTPNMITNIPWEILQTRSLTYWRTYHCSLQTLPSLKTLLRQAGFQDIIIEKHSLISDYNTERARRVLGMVGMTLMRLAKYCPLYLFPNFWGACRKPADVNKIVNG